jgi:flagellar hook-basal body complex protein FliE
MRAMAESARGGELNNAKANAEAGQPDFGAMLKNAIDSVNETQMEAGALKKAFEMGDPNVDIAEVMLAVQKAGISFQAMVQARNRIVSAYQDVMNMPI